MIDNSGIGRLLIETGRITKEDYAQAFRSSKETGKSFIEYLLEQGKVNVDELVQAIAVHMDITLLKEALGMEQTTWSTDKTSRPLGSYLERISLLFKMGTLLSDEKNLGGLIDLLVREAPSVMNAERATIFLADTATKELYSHLALGLKRNEIRIPWESGIAGWVFTRGKALNIVDPYNDPRFNKNVDPRTGYITKNVLCVPLRIPGGPILGVFQVLNKRAGVFTSTDQEILEILASQAARSLESMLEEDNPRGLFGTLGDDALPEGSYGDKHPLRRIIGNTKIIHEMRGLIRKVAPTDASVLIHGESGVGKELVAKAIHEMSSRRLAPLVVLNCAAVPAELIETELFGHKKGSFTGAVSDHKGVFGSAHNATLFLDEIEAMAPAMQVKLLRAIQEGEIRRVGDNVSQQVDVRLITATNSDLNVLMAKGTFREDLYYRINVFPVHISPLRERVEDIPLLIRHFLEQMAKRSGKRVKGVDPIAMDLLTRYPWPGNIRELENEIERAHIITGEGASISVRCISPKITQALQKAAEPPEHLQKPLTLKDATEQLEQEMITKALERFGGNKTAAARQLGLSRQGLFNKLVRYGFQE